MWAQATNGKKLEKCLPFASLLSKALRFGVLHYFCSDHFWAPQYRRSGHYGESPTLGCKDDEGTGASVLRREAERAGAVHPGEEGALGVSAMSINT